MEQEMKYGLFNVRKTRQSVRFLMFVIAMMDLGANALFAQNGTPSSKATADVNTLVKCNMTTAQVDDTTTLPASCVDLFTGAAQPVDPNGFVTIMQRTVKLSASQSLFVSPSLVTGLYTQTKTKTSTGSTSTATAMGGVYLRAVLVDAGGHEIVAAPLSYCNSGILGCAQATNGDWGVLLDSRIQTLSQELSNCVVNIDLVGTGSCTFTSTIDLVLQTTSAHTFNFIFPNVGQGVYTLQVKAAVASGASIISGGSGTAVGAAAFGLGSMSVESVRLVHDFSF
jgi:hypothetical protein